jgi:PTS system mannose-specific IIA component
MVGLLVISHGMLCEGIVDSVGMLAGQIEQLDTVSLKPGMAPETYQKMVREAGERLDTGSGVLVLVDLMGGTPFNTIAMLSQDLNVQILTGMNMAMLVTLALERTEETTLDELIKKAEEAAHNGIRILRRE